MQDSLVIVLAKLSETGVSYIWFIVLAIWGGTASYVSRVHKDATIKFSVVELIGEWTISSFAGIITALLCLEMQLSDLMTYALVGISGHAGGRAMFVFENLFKSKFGGQ